MTSASERQQSAPHARAEDLPGGLAGALAELGSEDYEWFAATVDGVERLDAPPEPAVLRHEKRAFILRRKTTRQKVEDLAKLLGSGAASGSGDRYDVEKKYPPDEPDQALGPNARVWRVYLDEAAQFDMDMVENIRDTVDVILVFAGLFSAVVGGLVTQSSTSLKLDYPQVTTALLTELILIQRAIASNLPVTSIPASPLQLESPPTSTASSVDFWVNGLWFTSLAISLSIALMAILVRQWLHAYVAPTSGTPKEQSHVRHFRYMGIEQWQVPLIAGLLPILLHLSLLLFFIGLIIFLYDLESAIAGVVTGIFAVVWFVYAITNLWPVFNVQCPYKTPLSDFILSNSRRLLSALRDVRQRMTRPPPSDTPSSHPSSRQSPEPETAISGAQRWSRSMKQMETEAVQAQVDELSVHMLSWMSTVSSSPSIRTVAIQALGDLPIEFTGSRALRTALLSEVCSRLGRLHQAWMTSNYQLSPDTQQTLYANALAHLTLDPNNSAGRDTYNEERCFQGDRCHWAFYDIVGRRKLANSSIVHPRLQSLRHVYLSPTHHTRDPWALTVPSPQDIVMLQPPAVSERVWIATLQGALIATREGPASDQSDFPGWPALSPLLHLACQPMTCTFDIVQNTLIYAYLCHLTRPAVSSIDDHPLLDEVLFYSEARGDLKLRLAEFEQTANHYRARLCIHVLFHSAPEESASLMDFKSGISTIVVEPDFIRVGNLTWAPFRPEPEVEERLLRYIPNPVFPDGTSTRYPKTMETLSMLSMILLHLDSPRLLDAFRNNRILESMHDMHKHMLRPGAHQHYHTMLRDEATKYIQVVLHVCSDREQRQRHMEYIFDHLKEICAWLVFSRKLRMDGFRQCISALLEYDPMHPQWGLVIDTLVQSELLTEEDKDAAGMFVRQVAESRRKLLANVRQQANLTSGVVSRMSLGWRRHDVEASHTTVEEVT